MTQTPGNNAWDYDAFISYARVDERFSGLISEVVTKVRAIFRSLTGRDLRLFLDREEISTASLWEQRILTALQSSAVLVPALTPSYFTSEWCSREWDIFTVLEAERRERHGLLPYESLVFPVVLTDADLLMTDSPEVQHRVSEFRKRQCVDVSRIDRQAAQFTTAITRLVIDLIATLNKLSPRDATGPPGPAARVVSGLAGTGRMIPLVATHSGTDEQRLTRLLADAHAATIVGVTNSWVADCLENALTLKRSRAGPDAFWDHLHIVFLADELLSFVHDDLSIDFPDPGQALRARIRRTGQTKRRVMSLLLRYGVVGRWTLYTYPCLLPFIGNIFSLPDDRRIVQLAIPRPSRGEKGNLCIDFLDRVDQYFESAFREVVEGSREEHEVVLVGGPGPRPGAFICRSARFRRSVLVEGRNSDDWLAAIVVLTWRHGEEGPEPLLQVNTPYNSTREIGKASHVSGYVNQLDHSQTREADDRAGEFEIPRKTIESAVQRELLDDFGITELPHQPRLLDTMRFFYPDKENLFFYVLVQELSATHRFPATVHMFPWNVGDLMTVRRGQVFSNALRMFNATLSTNQRSRASRIVCLNLRVHGEPEVADLVAEAVRQAQVGQPLIRRLQDGLAESTIHRYSAGRELYVNGLAGLQYRAFFSHLIPAYVSIGVSGARELSDSTLDDPARAEAVRELATLYDDGEFMVSIPIEV